MTTPEGLLPGQAFISRYGVVPNTDSLDISARSLFRAMDEYAGALYNLTSINHSDRETAETASRRTYIHTRMAMVHLFVDGSVNGFPIDLGPWEGNVPKGSKANNLADGMVSPAFVTTREEVKKEFKAVIDLLTSASNIDLSWLKILIGKSRKEIEQEVEQERLKLSPQQLAFLENAGFKTREERLKALRQ